MTEADYWARCQDMRRDDFDDDGYQNYEEDAAMAMRLQQEEEMLACLPIGSSTQRSQHAGGKNSMAQLSCAYCTNVQTMFANGLNSIHANASLFCTRMLVS